MLNRTHTKSFDTFRKSAPEWMTDEAILTLTRGYLLADEEIPEMYERIAKAGAAQLPDSELWAQDFEYIFKKGWFSPATPVAANLGANDSALPVSCFGIQVQNSIAKIFESIQEAAMLTKLCGGLGVDLSKIKGPTSVAEWGQFFDKVGSIVSQAGVRRGAVALYLDFDHPDLPDLLRAKDVAQGDPRSKIDCNIAVKINNNDIERIKAGEPEAIELFSKILESRLKVGSPYIQFVDNCIKQDPFVYKINGLKCGAMQLCNEITLFHDEYHSYSCVLSSLNVEKYDEWRFWRNSKGWSVPALATAFLDGVCQEFINNSENKVGLEKARRGALKGRPLGLGVLGLHGYYQKKGLAWSSPEAFQLNKNIFSFIQEQATKATNYLAKELGEPEWCKGLGIRNTHLMAMAPTTTNSVICGASSPGIEPSMANYFAVEGAKGTFTRQNKYLKEVLIKYNKDNGYVWSSIRENQGSVQHLEFLSQAEKDIFKTAIEINQFDIIKQASDRQAFIDQGQSLNLFIRHDESAENIVKLHMLAHELNLKGLYYVRSTSAMAQQASSIDFVYLKTRPDCIYCKMAKELLDSKNIKYQEEYMPTGRVPEIYIDGEKLDDGYQSLLKRFSMQEIKSDCVSCEG